MEIQTLPLYRRGMAHDQHNTIGARVRQLRLDQGLTQRELAEPRYSRSFLVPVESGTRNPSAEALRYLAERLHVDIDDLRYGRPTGIGADLTRAISAARKRLSCGEVDAATSDFHQILAQATQYHLPEQQLWARYYLGETRLHRGDMTGALAELAKTATLTEHVPAIAQMAVLAKTASCHFFSGDLVRATSILEGALRARAPGEADAELQLITALLYICVELDWQDRARRLITDGMALLPQAADREGIAHFNSVASQAPQQDQKTVAGMMHTALEIYTELGLRREIGVCHWSRGYVHRRLGRLDTAAAEFGKAREILREVGAIQDHAGATLEFAEVRRLQGDLEGAAVLAGESRTVFLKSGHIEALGEADRLLGRVAAATGQTREAEQLLRQAAARYGQVGLPQEQVTTLRELGDLLLATDQLDDALEVLRHGVARAAQVR